MKRKTILDLFKKEEFFNFSKNHLVNSLIHNSKEFSPHSVFFAIKGTVTDGHKFIEDAIKKGVETVVLQNREKAEILKRMYPELNTVLVENTRKKIAEISRLFFDYPDKKLKIIGITGTNGKTTVSHLIAQYLQLQKIKVGIIGTTGYKVGENLLSEGRTTPDSLQWYQLLSQMKQMGAEFVVAEISSHALDQYRVYGTEFDGIVFTNLSPEHLDYHLNMENYFQAKRKLFGWNTQSPSVVNVDNIYGKRLLEEFENSSGYGFSNEAYFKISDLSLSITGSAYTIFYKGKGYSIKTKLIGKFNIYNITAAFSILVKIGFKPEILSKLSPKLTPVRGRMEIVKGKDFIVVIDYAHTPDALENVLQTLKEFKKGRLITVFGAGGDRDRTKRPVMGRVASDYSDVVIITSDNPRSEEPLSIIRDIKKGVKRGADVHIIPDREDAIKEAIYMAKENDTILIAGKGHETYQELKGVKIFFDDKKTAQEYVRKKREQR